MYTCRVIGSHFRDVTPASVRGATMPEAVQYGLRAMLDIVEGDSFHAGDAARAFEYWTPDEIRRDMETAGRCDIVISGGYYVIEIVRD